MVLSDYLQSVRFLLEEFAFSGIVTTSPTAFWSDTQLIDCINKGRDRVAIDTFCTRTIQFIQAVQGQQVYSFATVLASALALTPPPPARGIAHVHNVNFQWAVSFQPSMRRMGWSEFNARYRAYPTLQSQSAVYGMYDLQSFYVWPPPPASTYQMEVDATYIPIKLSQPGDVETAIPEFLSDRLVPLYAARWACYYKRSFNEADTFNSLYIEERDQLVGAAPAWSVESWYED